jgi:hypothetical protein
MEPIRVTTCLTGYLPPAFDWPLLIIHGPNFGLDDCIPLQNPAIAILPLALTDTSTIKWLSVLITGGVSGLGFHAATFFANSRAFVTIADVQDGSKLATDPVTQGYMA